MAVGRYRLQCRCVNGLKFLTSFLMQTTVGRLIVERECQKYGMVHAFFIPLSQSSDGTDLRNQYRNELRQSEQQSFRFPFFSKFLKYQPSGTGGTLTACNAAPPGKSKMAARGPQNGRRGLERCLPLGFGALPSTFAK